ncbi:MAG: mobile mystery protein A [Proteobacteria bacterium]|nr:mobile mystery protein A [Pseudomonadota bacterium]
MKTPARLLSLEQFDKDLPRLRQSAALLERGAPREGWVRSLRQSLGMSMRSFSRRIGFKEPASVKELERNERAGTITLQTLKRAAEALDADLVYAIVPRKALRETVRARAREVARARVAPIAKSMALEAQGLTAAQIDRQIRELARELEQKPETLWR